MSDGIIDRVRSSEFPKRDLVRYAFAKVGFSTDTIIHYPDLPPLPDRSSRTFRVRYHPIWKQMERGEWEHRTFERLANIINAGDIVIDAGAWIGTHTLFMGALVGETGKVYAFEPDPDAYSILATNLQLNHINNVVLSSKCLTDLPSGHALLRSLHFGNSASSITTFAGIDKFKGDQQDVSITSIDAFCSDGDIKPAGIKMDIQGSESLALRGAAHIIDTYHPWVVAEFHGRHFTDQQVRSAKWMEFMKFGRSVNMVEGDWNDVATVYLQT